MNLRGVDLNLLPVLAALLRESSVSGAARSLGLSQPATSHALMRLRHLLDDPLLVRTGRDMKLTNRARALVPLCEAACAAIEAVVVQEIFDPAAAKLHFSIATPDYLALLLGQELLPILRQQAPGISVRFVDVGQSVREQLASGSIDLAVIAYLPDVLEGLSVAHGFIDPLVCVAAQGHPVARQRQVAWAEISEHSRLALDSTPDLFVPASPQGRTEPVSIAASHLMVLPLLAGRSGTFAVVPRSLALQAAHLAGFTLVDLEDDTRSMDYCLAWNPGHDRDRGHAWLRSVLSDILERNFPVPDGKGKSDGH